MNDKIIPVITEARLEEVEWKCECGAATHGGHCHECGDPHPRGMVVIPDGPEGEEVLNRITTPRRCGGCRHYDLKTGQEIVQNPKDPFYQKLVREMGLKSITERIDFNRLGLCRYWTGGNDERFWVCDTSPAQVHRQRLDSSTPYRSGDLSVDCPAYELRDSSDGRVIESFRQVPGSRTRGTE